MSWLEASNRRDAAHIRNIAASIVRIGVKEDPTLFEREITFLNDAADALESVVPSIREGRRGETETNLAQVLWQ